MNRSHDLGKSVARTAGASRFFLQSRGDSTRVAVDFSPRRSAPHTKASRWRRLKSFPESRGSGIADAMRYPFPSAPEVHGYFRCLAPRGNHAAVAGSKKVRCANDCCENSCFVWRRSALIYCVRKMKNRRGSVSVDTFVRLNVPNSSNWLVRIGTHDASGVATLVCVNRTKLAPFGPPTPAVRI